MQDEEQILAAFRKEARAFLRGHLPQDIRRAVLHHRRPHKQGYLRWHSILHARSWSVMQRHVFDEEYSLVGAPKVTPFATREMALAHSLGDERHHLAVMAQTLLPGATSDFF